MALGCPGHILGPGVGCHGHAACAGYVSIGFTGIAGKMGPADTYAGWVDVAGAHVIDFSTKQGYSINLPDAQQDAVNVSASISNGVVAVTFSRKLDTAVCVVYNGL